MKNVSWTLALSILILTGCAEEMRFCTISIPVVKVELP